MAKAKRGVSYKKRKVSEVKSYFKGRGILQKGDIIIHKIKPKGKKRYTTTYKTKIK